MISKDKKYRILKDHPGLCMAGTVVSPATDQITHELVIGVTGKHLFNLTVGSLFFSESEVEEV
jgi:hypothetical protein